MNEYLSGQGIFKHLDGPLFYPTISTLSLGSHTVLEFFKAGNEEENASSSPDFKIYVEPRSLLILKNSMYDTYLHSISEITEDDLNDQLILNIDKSHKNMLPRVTRYSLTIRHVPKTSKMKIKFGK